MFDLTSIFSRFWKRSNRFIKPARSGAPMPPVLEPKREPEIPGTTPTSITIDEEIAKMGEYSKPAPYNKEKLTKNFSRWEFECPCCGLNNISKPLVENLQKLRDLIAKITGEERSFNITSGCRCTQHNREVGGAPHSRHTEPNLDAADIVVRGLKAESVKYYACMIPEFLNSGIGLYKKYPGMIHLDDRGVKTRWIH